MENLLRYLNFQIVNKKANKLYNRDVFLSTRKDKKYMIMNNANKWIHFGQLGYQDFTKHLDENRRLNYLKRSTKIKGNWKENIFSPNNLSINLLWN